MVAKKDISRHSISVVTDVSATVNKDKVKFLHIHNGSHLENTH